MNWNFLRASTLCIKLNIGFILNPGPIYLVCMTSGSREMMQGTQNISLSRELVAVWHWILPLGYLILCSLMVFNPPSFLSMRQKFILDMSVHFKLFLLFVLGGGFWSMAQAPNNTQIEDLRLRLITINENNEINIALDPSGHQVLGLFVNESESRHI